jgi:hypothetical protein
MKSGILNLAGVVFLLCSYAKADEYPYLRRQINGHVFGFKQIKVVETEDSGSELDVETLKPKKDRDYHMNVSLVMEGSGVSSLEYKLSHEHLEGAFPTKLVLKYMTGPKSRDPNTTLVIPKDAKVTVDLDYCLGRYMNPNSYSILLGSAIYKIDLGENNGHLLFELMDHQLQEANYNQDTKTNVDDRVQVEDQIDERKLNLNSNLSDFKNEIMGLLDSKIQEFSARFNLPLDSPSNTPTQNESIL